MLNVYKKVLQGFYYEKFNGAEEFIKNKIEEICSNEKLLLEEVTFFVYERLRELLKLKLDMFVKILQALFACSVTTVIFFCNNKHDLSKCSWIYSAFLMFTLDAEFGCERYNLED